MKATHKRQLLAFADHIEDTVRNNPPPSEGVDKWRFPMGNGTNYTVQCRPDVEAVHIVADKIRKCARSRQVVFKT